MGMIYDEKLINDTAKQLLCGVTKRMAGIELRALPAGPPGISTEGMEAVFCRVSGDLRMQLQLCAAPEAYLYLVRNILGSEPVDQEEHEDYMTEFFNVFCGRFVSILHDVMGLRGRMSPPCYERPPNVTVLNSAPPHSLYFAGESECVLIFTWTIMPVESIS